MTIPPKIDREIKALGRLLREEGIEFDDIYLFGSLARGEAGTWSDIDIGIVSDPFGTDRIAEMVTLRSLSYPINPALSPVPLRPQDLQDRFSPLGQAIKKEGIRINTQSNNN